MYKRQTQRIEHLTRRITNLLNWPGDKVTPPDAQKFAEEALQQLPELMRELRRRYESFRLEEIEEAMMKLNISPTQSPTQEQQTGKMCIRDSIIAGQGTLGLEVVEQVPDIDAVVVPVGGGGFIAGVALAVKTLHPNIKVIVSIVYFPAIVLT